MTTDALLALDVGTSGCRAELFALSGESLARHYLEYGLSSPAPGAAEQAPEGWWQAVVTCTRAALADARPAATRVRAVGLSVQGHSWVPADARFNPVRPALTWLDARASAAAGRLLDDHPAAFWGAQAGKCPGQWHLLPQLLWLRQAEAETLAQARYYLFAHDYLLARLTGRLLTDYTTAAGSLLLDIRDRAWSAPLLAEYDVAAAALSTVVPAGTAAGALLPEAASELGLPQDALVAVGAQDQKAASLAAGLRHGTATVSLGTATAVTAITPRAGFSLEHGAIPCFPYLQAGQWVLEAPLATAGGALRWLRDLVGGRGQGGYQSLIAAAGALPPGAAGVRFFPYLAGAGAPHWRGEARGGCSGLGLDSGPGHLARALLEAVAYDIRASLEHMRAQGCPVERLVVFGGGARSSLWPRVIAAVCGLTTEAGAETEAASRGAAMLAARALGLPETPFTLRLQPVAAPEGWTDAYADLRERYAVARERFWELGEE